MSAPRNIKPQNNSPAVDAALHRANNNTSAKLLKEELEKRDAALALELAKKFDLEMQQDLESERLAERLQEEERNEYLARQLEQEEQDAIYAQKVVQEEQDAIYAQKAAQEEQDANYAQQLDQEEKAAYAAQQLANEEPAEVNHAAAVQQPAPVAAPAANPAPAEDPAPVATTEVGEQTAKAEAITNAKDAEKLREELNQGLRLATTDPVKQDIRKAQIVLARKGFHKNTECPITLEDLTDNANGQITTDNIVVLDDGTAVDLPSFVRFHNGRQPGTDCGQDNKTADMDGTGKFLINPAIQMPCSPEATAHVLQSIEKYNNNPSNTNKLKLHNLKAHNAGDLSADEQAAQAERANEAAEQERLFAQYRQPTLNMNGMFRQPRFTQQHDEGNILGAILFLQMVRALQFQLIQQFMFMLPQQPDVVVHHVRAFR